MFASANAVDYFMRRLLAIGDVRDLHGVRLCTVGPSTASRLQRYGIRVDLTPAEFRADALTEALKASGSLKGQRILMPRADIARDRLAEELREAGAEVVDVVAYRTIPGERRARRRYDIYRMLLDRQIDAVTFASASAVRNFVAMLGQEQAADLLHSTVVASIGPVTAEAAQQLGIETTVMPQRYTIPDLVDALVEHFERASTDLIMTTRTQSDTAHGSHARRRTATRRPDILRHRPRRLRRTPAMRALVRETRLSPDKFIYPLFVCTGEGQRREVGSMPGVFQLSVDEAVREAAAAKADGRAGRAALRPAGREGRRRARAPTIRRRRCRPRSRAIKREVPGLLVVTDVCLCEYTSHGHCGILVDDEIANDATVEQLVRAALSHAAAGADIVAPSDMMDGRVGASATALDDAGFHADRDHVVRGEVLLGVLRPVPRGGRLGAGVRRSPLAPDGSGQRRGGAARGGARHRGRGRHRHGQAGAARTST